MRGIVLAGGTGTRLGPLTKSVSKQLLPVFDKPLVYYPIATLMQAGIKEILIITTLQDQDSFITLLGDGSQFGVSIQYEVQEKPGGLAEAFIVGKDFIKNDGVVLILGDNLFSGIDDQDLDFGKIVNGARIFTYAVSNPEAYGVLSLDENGNIESIIEKPEKPKSNLAVTGLYYFDSSVVTRAQTLSPSSRGELEIVDLIKLYLAEKTLQVTNLPAGTVWLDTGTPEGLHDAASYVRVIEERTAIKIGCLEEIAFLKGWIDKNHLNSIIEKNGNNAYGKYLKRLLDRNL
jgi:glucose-1-phosphate thymidylyltransferase